MPKKVSHSNAAAAASESTSTAAAVAAPAPAPTPASTSSRRQKKAPSAAPVVVAVDSAAATESVVEKTRQNPTRESVEREFEDVIGSVNEEIANLRQSSSKSKGVKFLRTLNKRLKTLRHHALRISRARTSVRRSNTNSGFLKPVQISKDLAKFTGWDANQPRSRVDVTKFICEYIKQHNLQDPQDKRKIRVESDANLKKLLRYDGAKDGKPLTYYSLQSYLKGHFTAPTAEATKTK